MHEELNSYFGAGVKMNGVLKFQGALRFDGVFQGVIQTPDTLIVGNNGKIEARINIGSLFNMGEIVGDIKAEQKIAIFTNSHITGNIDTPILRAEEGAVFMGNCHMPYNPPKVSDNGKQKKEPKRALASDFEVAMPADIHEAEQKEPIRLFPEGAFAKVGKGLFLAGLFAALIYSGNYFVQWSRADVRKNPLSLMIYTKYLGDDSGKIQKLAEKWYSEGEYGKASTLFLEARRLSKGGIPLDISLPIALEKSKGMKDAAPYYEEWLKKDPDDKKVLAKIAAYYKESGDHEGELRIAEQLLNQNPENIEAVKNLYSLHIQQGRIAKAYDLYVSKVISKNPTNEELKVKGGLETKLNRINLAIETYEKLADADKKDVNIRLQLAYLYHKSGNEYKAAGEFRRVESLDKENVETLNNAGYENLSASYTDKAVELFNMALEKSPDNLRAYHGLATTFVKIGDTGKAKFYCEKILAIDPNYAPGLNRFAWVLAMEMTDLEQAEKYSLSSMQFDQNLPDYLDTLAEIYYRKGEFDLAIQTIEKAMELKPGNAWLKGQLMKFREARSKSPQQQAIAPEVPQDSEEDMVGQETD